MRSFDPLSLAAAAVLVVAACSGTSGSGPTDGSSGGGDIGTEGGVEAEASTMGEAGDQTPDGNLNETPDAEGGQAGSDADATATNDSGYDGGPVACGPMTCGAHEICMFNQTEGGAVQRPDDAGNCPHGEVLTGISCSSPPSYQCVALPAACSAGVSCGCAKSLCQSAYQCMSVSAGVIGCYLYAP